MLEFDEGLIPESEIFGRFESLFIVLEFLKGHCEEVVPSAELTQRLVHRVEFQDRLDDEDSFVKIMLGMEGI